ncbi:MAG: AsmA family protein [Pseudomonadota bacterium]
MKRLAIIAAIIVAILIGALLILPNLIPSSVYKNRIESAATNALGRDVSLLGEARLSVFPRISVKLGGMEVANPEGYTGTNMIEAGALRADVKLLPLLFQRVEIGEVTLEDATIRLERLEDGTANWEFGDASDEAASDPDTSTPPTDVEPGEPSQVNATLDRARITNGNIFYTDRQAETSLALTEFNAQARMRATTQPLTSSGSGVFNGRAFEYDVMVDHIDALSAGEETAFELDFSTEFASVNYNGALTLGDAPILAGAFELGVDQAQSLFLPANPLHAQLAALGKLDLSGEVSGPIAALQFLDLALTQSSDLLDTRFNGALALGTDGNFSGALNTSSKDLRTLLSVFGVELAPGDTLESFSLDGDLAGSMATPQFNEMRLQLDDTVATGSLGADLSGDIPAIQATLNTNGLDLTPFLASDDSAPDTEPSMNEDWSDEPLALDSLKLVNANIDITADSVTLDQITLDDARLLTTLQNGVLTAVFRRDENAPGFRAFDGSWSGDLRLDASRTTPSLAAKADASGVAAQQVLRAFTGYEGLTGVGSLSIDLASTGNSLKALINDLDGSLDTELADGLVAGIDMAQMVRSADALTSALRSGDLNVGAFQAAFEPSAETDFSEMLGDLQFNNGVATVQDLRLVNSILAVEGAGTIDLGARTLDIRLTPKIDATGSGTQSTLGVAGIPIPVRIAGSWTSPSFALDLQSVQQSLASGFSDQLDGELRNLLGGALGSSSRETDDADAEEEPQDLEDELRDRALDALFGNR